MSNAWAPCLDGCGLSHRRGDSNPMHDPAWLARERVRLLAEVAQLRGDHVDEALAGMRERRVMPLLTDSANETGVRLDVTLEPPPKKRR